MRVSDYFTSYHDSLKAVNCYQSNLIMIIATMYRNGGIASLPKYFPELIKELINNPYITPEQRNATVVIRSNRLGTTIPNLPLRKLWRSLVGSSTFTKEMRKVFINPSLGKFPLTHPDWDTVELRYDKRKNAIDKDWRPSIQAVERILSTLPPPKIKERNKYVYTMSEFLAEHRTLLVNNMHKTNVRYMLILLQLKAITAPRYPVPQYIITALDAILISKETSPKLVGASLREIMLDGHPALSRLASSTVQNSNINSYIQRNYFPQWINRKTTIKFLKGSTFDVPFSLTREGTLCGESNITRDYVKEYLYV